MMFGKPKGEGWLCHETGFRERCNKGRGGECPKWLHVQGKHPSSGADIDLFDCADRWVPIMLMEIAQKQNHAGAAIESLRNNVVKASERLGDDMKIAAAIARGPLPAPERNLKVIDGG